MAGVIRRNFFETSRKDVYTIVPIGDVHIGAAACDENAFRATVKRVADDDKCYWIGMGDACDFINVSDPRFSAQNIAPWLTVSKLADIVTAQKEHYLDIVRPIAHKCLAMVSGNHEHTILRKYERNIHLELVAGIKEMGKMKQEQKLGIDTYGWLRLAFHRGPVDNPNPVSILDFNLHHGFVGGKLAGAKALNMQRWLWTHDCDVVIFGHSHNIMAQPEAVETLNRGDKIVMKTRKGCFGGSFLRTTGNDDGSTYSERKGYFPLPSGGCEIVLQPRAKNKLLRIRIIT